MTEISHHHSLTGLADQDIQEMMDAGLKDWLELKHARILLTGATGWFGTWLLDALVAANRSFKLDLTILAMSRNPERFKARHPALYEAAEIEWIRADILDWPGSVADAVTHIIHAATDARPALNFSNPDVMFDTIVLGTRAVLRLARDAGCRAMLMVSTGGIYGIQPSDVAALREDAAIGPDPSDPYFAYAEGKRAAEQLCAIWHAHHGVPTCIARCFTFVGPHMPLDGHFAIGNFISNAASGRTIEVKGDGLPVRTWLYMTDMVTWLLHLLVRGTPGRAYNVGSNEAASIRTLAERVGSIANVPVHIASREVSAVKFYLPDIERARTELGLRIAVPLDDAIARTLVWAKRVRLTKYSDTY